MAPNFPSARTVSANGIELAVHEAGEGTPVLLLHGFPELAYSWRHQVGPIADAGFRVIVPNQRGYDGSSAPQDAQSYSVKNLVADLTGMLDALEIEQAVFFGHDWGSMPAWYSAVYAPDRVLGMGSLCTPYFTPGEVDLIEAYDAFAGRTTTWRRSRSRAWARAILERDVRRRSGRCCAAAATRWTSSRRPRRRSARSRRGLRRRPPAVRGRAPHDEELAVYVDTYRRTGFTGGLNWYRALHKDWEEAQGHEFVVDKPALMISAADDWFFPRGATDGMEQLLPQVEKHVIADAGHWLQQEKPDEVNALLVPWLQRNFG